MARFLCTFLMMLIVASPSFAGTAITLDMAEKYFANCIAASQKEQKLSEKNQQQYCACTAINMQKSMTQEDLADLSSQGDTARAALNKILIHVNGPCMQYPVQDMIGKECMGKMNNGAMCNCLSNKMGSFTKEYSAKMMPQILAKDPNIYDPMTPIMETQEFQQTQQQIALSCMTNPNQ